MRVVTISLNGIKKAAESGFFEWMKQQNADVVCVQDLRAKVYELDDPIYHPKGYETHYLDAENPADGGVGIYSRQIPKAIMYGFAYEQADVEGRFLQADFADFSVATVLAPSAYGEIDIVKQREKDQFFDAFKGHLIKTLRKRRQFIFCGNFQTAYQVADASPEYHAIDVSGFLPHERAWFDDVFETMEYGDAFREINREGNQYSWWPSKSAGAGLENHAGWRTDYQIISPGVRAAVRKAVIDTSAKFSDHAPVIIDYDFD